MRERERERDTRRNWVQKAVTSAPLGAARAEHLASTALQRRLFFELLFPTAWNALVSEESDCSLSPLRSAEDAFRVKHRPK